MRGPVGIETQRDVAARADFEDDPAPRQLLHQRRIVGRTHAMSDARHRQVADRGPDAVRPQHLAGMHGAAIAALVRVPVGRREIDGGELGLVASHAEAHDIGMRFGDHRLDHRVGALRPEMADADDDDAADDPEVPLGIVDALDQRGQPGGIGDAERGRPLGRAEHLDIDRALARRAGQVGVDHVTKVARRLQGRADAVVGLEEAPEIRPGVVALLVEQVRRQDEPVAFGQRDGELRRDRAFEMAVDFGLGNHANPRSGRSGRCSQLSAG